MDTKQILVENKIKKALQDCDIRVIYSIIQNHGITVHRYLMGMAM